MEKQKIKRILKILELLEIEGIKVYKSIEIQKDIFYRDDIRKILETCEKQNVLFYISARSDKMFCRIH